MIKELEELGLTRGEAAVYLALTHLKESAVGNIVKESKVAYSKIYDVLQRLLGKGLVSYTIKERTKFFSPMPASALKDFLSKKEKELSEQKEKLDNIFPKLETFTKKETDETRMYLGKRGIFSAYKVFIELMENEEKVKYFYPYNKEYDEEVREFYGSGTFKELIKQTFKEKRISWFCLTNQKKIGQDKLPFMHYRYLSTPIPGIIDINKKAILITIWSKNPQAILITSRQVASNFLNYFNEMWEQGKGVK